MSSTIQQSQLQQQKEAQQLARDLEQMDVKLNQLKVAYEHYFLGLERLEPNKLRKEVSDLVKKYNGAQIQNTAQKFRLNALVAKHNSFQAYWNRVLRELEDGTFKRDQFKKKLHEAENSKAGAIPEKSQPPAANPNTNAKGDALSLLLQHYLQARRQTNEKTDGITREALEKVVLTQTEAIKKQTNCKRVSFKVVVEGGKAKIKAIPKNE